MNVTRNHQLLIKHTGHAHPTSESKSTLVARSVPRTRDKCSQDEYNCKEAHPVVQHTEYYHYNKTITFHAAGPGSGMLMPWSTAIIMFANYALYIPTVQHSILILAKLARYSRRKFREISPSPGVFVQTPGKRTLSLHIHTCQRILSCTAAASCTGKEQAYKQQ